MFAKKVVVGLSCAVILSAFFLIAILNQTKISPDETNETKTTTNTQNPIQTQPVKIEKKYDLYSSSPYDLPLYSIMEISKLSDDVKKVTDEILEQAGGFYYLKNVNKDKTILILPNSISNNDTYSRHNLEIVEIIKNEDNIISKNIIPLGYRGCEGEISNAVSQDLKRDDYWKFDKSSEPYRPTKHVIYDEKGKTKYTEIWNYSPKETVKYMMKDAKGKILSIFTETLENDLNLRQEHIFYDEDGNIAITLSANYNGANITRFTYFNSFEPYLNATIMTEYNDGLKQKEMIYADNYKLLNTVTADYIDTERKTIKSFDAENNKLNQISS